MCNLIQVKSTEKSSPILTLLECGGPEPEWSVQLSVGEDKFLEQNAPPIIMRTEGTSVLFFGHILQSYDLSVCLEVSENQSPALWTCL